MVSKENGGRRRKREANVVVWSTGIVGSGERRNRVVAYIRVAG